MLGGKTEAKRPPVGWRREEIVDWERASPDVVNIYLKGPSSLSC